MKYQNNICPDHNNTLLKISTIVSLTLHIALSPIVTKLLYLHKQKDKTNHILITEILDNVSQGTNHKTKCISHSQVIGVTPIDIDTITLETPLQPHCTPYQKTTVKLRKNDIKHNTTISRRKNIPLSRKPLHLQRKYTKTIAKTILSNIPQIDLQNAPKNNAKVMIKVVINPVNGFLKNISILKSSNNWALDQAGIMAIKKSMPFPPLDIPLDKIVFIIPITYKR